MGVKELTITATCVVVYKYVNPPPRTEWDDVGNLKNQFFLKKKFYCASGNWAHQGKPWTDHRIWEAGNRSSWVDPDHHCEALRQEVCQHSCWSSARDVRV